MRKQILSALIIITVLFTELSFASKGSSMDDTISSMQEEEAKTQEKISDLEKQTQELVLVRPKSVDEKYDEITADFSKSRSVCMDSASNVDYAGGVQAGRDAIRATRLNGDSVKKLGR